MAREKSAKSRGRIASKEPAAVSLGAFTHIGMRRQGNQDAFCALGGTEAPNGADGFVAVADGMGGHSAGEVASSMAVDNLLRRLRSQKRRAASGASDDGLGLTEAVRHVGERLHREAARPELRGMGTTLTAALLAGGSLHIAHVGDSRAYLLRDGRLQQLTRDHSWVGEQVAAGLLTPAEARVHPRRNILTRALGPKPQADIDSTETSLKAEDTLMLCSDGLHTLISDDELVQELSGGKPQEACERLVEEANARGGSDNITVVVMRMRGEMNEDNGGFEARGNGRSLAGRALARLSKTVSPKRSRGDGAREHGAQ